MGEADVVPIQLQPQRHVGMTPALLHRLDSVARADRVARPPRQVKGQTSAGEHAQERMVAAPAWLVGMATPGDVLLPPVAGVHRGVSLGR